MEWPTCPPIPGLQFTLRGVRSGRSDPHFNQRHSRLEAHATTITLAALHAPSPLQSIKDPDIIDALLSLQTRLKPRG